MRGLTSYSYVIKVTLHVNKYQWLNGQLKIVQLFTIILPHLVTENC